jgi:TPR repeat protein
VELFKNVAERGKWGRMLMHAHTNYKEGKVLQAFIKYAFAAELGYEVAQSNAAFILDRQEVDIFNKNESLIRALMYWSRSAAQGNAVARVKLGDYHYYGCGTRVDYEAAAYQYRLASEQQQNPQALFNLGFMHEQGLGLAKDFNLAKRYYDQAAESSPDAQVPVALALLKLALVYAWELIRVTHWSSLFGAGRVVRTFGPDWDLYLMTALAVTLAILVYFRRPQPLLRQ